MMKRIYCEQKLNINTTVTLADLVASRLLRVLRKSTGEELIIFNEQDGEFLGIIESLNKQRNRVEIFLKSSLNPCGMSALSVHIGQVMTKRDTLDWVVQKTTELGVDHITFLTSEYCNQSKAKLAHWQQIAISACEQCGRTKLPNIAGPITYYNWIDQAQSDAVKILLHPLKDCRVHFSLAQNKIPKKVFIAIGPEGGFSTQEVDYAIQKGFQVLQLGERILRSETAPVAILAILQSLWGDFRATIQSI